MEFLHPEWNSLEEESVDNTLDIFKFDSLKSSHAVSVEIGHPNQISQIFGEDSRNNNHFTVITYLSAYFQMQFHIKKDHVF